MDCPNLFGSSSAKILYGSNLFGSRGAKMLDCPNLLGVQMCKNVGLSQEIKRILRTVPRNKKIFLLSVPRPGKPKNWGQSGSFANASPTKHVGTVQL